jgi:hypothetical protein
MSDAPRHHAPDGAVFAIVDLPYATGELLMAGCDALLASLETAEAAAMASGDTSREATMRQRQQHVQCAKDALEEAMDEDALAHGYPPTAEERWEMREEERGDARREAS